MQVKDKTMEKISAYKDKESAENYEICKHIIATARKINKMGYGHIKFKPVPQHNEEKAEHNR